MKWLKVTGKKTLNWSQDSCHKIKNSDRTVAKLCPVRSFENYINALDKTIDFLWQRPKNKFPKNKEFPWYITKQVGHNTHEKFMGELCKKMDLTKHYTNHCIQVSGVMNLTWVNFTAKQVMSVSGHKSVELLALYQRVHEDKKMMMGLCLTYSLMNPHNARREIAEQSEWAPTPQLPMLPSTSYQQDPKLPQTNAIQVKELVPVNKAIAPCTPNVSTNPPPAINTSANFNLMELLSETIDEVNDQDLVMVTTQCEQALIPNTKIMTNTSNTAVMKCNNPQTTFTNWTFRSIGTLNIHIHKD